ncbi:hypothetical protein CTM75_09915 [Photobacterium phosphoreum]|nr:hypothetical protein CTM80_12100 [Photobacterium phosphoreum]PSU62535.1 hypothetical protein CTM75_09915 [Photobacterium phosphoreum]
MFERGTLVRQFEVLNHLQQQPLNPIRHHQQRELREDQLLVSHDADHKQYQNPLLPIQRHYHN